MCSSDLDRVYLYTENEEIVGVVAIKGETLLEGPFIKKGADHRSIVNLLLEHCQDYYGVLTSTLPDTNEPLIEAFFNSGFEVLKKAYDDSLKTDTLKVQWSRKNH